MSIALGQLNLGKVDGKHEYLTPQSERDHLFYDAFLVPESVDPERLHNGDQYYVQGFRGTGKTSLLRWYAETKRKQGVHTNFILFKSDLTEQQRLSISKEIGVSWADVDSRGMEVSQDFKATWTWFVHHKLGELFSSEPGICEGEQVAQYCRMLGIKDNTVFTKVLGFLPKLDGANIKVKSDLKFFELELGGDFKADSSVGSTTLEALCRRLNAIVATINIKKPVYMFFDELEVFYQSPEQYRRDQRMVRDLLFCVDALNSQFREAKLPIHLVGAVRSEVIDNMGSLGQEVDRLVHDRGFHITWHSAKRSLDNPLLKIIKRKIIASEKSLGINEPGDPLLRYFPRQVNEQSLDAFLLDRSFYKPRDIVWRLTIAQKQFPNASSFSQEILQQTETDYSSKLWDEIRYELSAVYSTSDIDVIEMVFSGAPVGFTLEEMRRRFDDAAAYSTNAKSLTSKRSIQEVLSDLYRLGAIGNLIRISTTGSDTRMRFAFRGDPVLLPDRSMILHSGLVKRLSAAYPRKRGTRGGRER